MLPGRFGADEGCFKQGSCLTKTGSAIYVNLQQEKRGIFTLITYGEDPHTY
jgi:hypothetical protein